MKIGYTCGPPGDPQRQARLAALRGAGCDKVLDDPALPRRGIVAPQLAQALARVTTGDTLVITTLDCLGYGLPDVTRVIRQLAFVCAELRAISDGIDTTVPWGIPQLLATLRGTRRLPGRHRAAAMKAAQQSGTRFGRARKLTPDQVERARRETATGRTQQQLALEYGVSAATIGRALRRASGLSTQQQKESEWVS